MDVVEKRLRKYYRKNADNEWRRLFPDSFHSLEYNTTLHFLQKYLPKKGFVLDAGGGPGRYTIKLAKIGYEMILLDITPELLEIAKKQIKKADVQKNVKDVILGSIHDLSRFDDNTFNAVICLGGALCHILDKKKRKKTLSELIRVAKKSAPIFISVIGRFAVLEGGLVLLPNELERVPQIYDKILETGDFLGEYGFAPFHSYLPNELTEQLINKNVEILEQVGLESLASHHQQETNNLHKKYKRGWVAWQKIHMATCTDPALVATSEHFLIICRK